MMYSCRQASELMSACLDQKLSLYQRISLKIHLFMCRYCSRCWQQMHFIRGAMQYCSERSEELEFMQGQSLSEEACDRIKRSMKERTNQ